VDTLGTSRPTTHTNNNDVFKYKKRLDSVLSLSRKFVLAECESEIITPLLSETINHTQAFGASFVPLDENGVPHSSISQGISFSETQLNDWVEYLAAPSVHGRCRACNKNHPSDSTCPLLVKHPFKESFNLICFHAQKDTQKFGVLNLYLPKNVALDDGTNKFLQILVDETSLAIDGIRLREKKQHKLAQLEVLSKQQNKDIISQAEIKIDAILEERTRLAREFHDGLAQVLGYVKLQLSQARMALDRSDTAQANELIQSSYQAITEAFLDTREAIDDLHLNTLEDDFLTWLNQIAENFEINHQISITIFRSLDNFTLSPLVRLQVIRIFQEAFSNIRKHSDASELYIRFIFEDNYLVIEIEDNGKGFSSEDNYEPSQHGLKSMRERADLISAKFDISSEIGEGAKIHLQLPEGCFEIIQ